MSQNRTTSGYGPNDWGHDFTQTFRDSIPHIIPPPCVSSKIGEFFSCKNYWKNDFVLDGHIFLRNVNLFRDENCWTNFGTYAIWCYRLRTLGAQPTLIRMSLWLDNQRDNFGFTFRFLQFFLKSAPIMYVFMYLYIYLFIYLSIYLFTLRFCRVWHGVVW
jgi:hypothetical protein